MIDHPLTVPGRQLLCLERVLQKLFQRRALFFEPSQIGNGIFRRPRGLNIHWLTRRAGASFHHAQLGFGSRRVDVAALLGTVRCDRPRTAAPEEVSSSVCRTCRRRSCHGRQDSSDCLSTSPALQELMRLAASERVTVRGERFRALRRGRRRCRSVWLTVTFVESHADPHVLASSGDQTYQVDGP